MVLLAFASKTAIVLRHRVVLDVRRALWMGDKSSSSETSSQLVMIIGLESG